MSKRPFALANVRDENWSSDWEGKPRHLLWNRMESRL
jgi:hypothetical protein